ncbi:hypothetical protein BU23DRAFT_555480 [Bimuria novae-zelandiae CBS 107.79]|uniref:Heterokaryon incompatibility domain-containing protein n=1 Tax=Bimuria novae-zelandiae CBS 107.79 TaxID=1447943 RepID=A0A6A5V508_9PLEO|nr:hypothetical protein BU23DRAFT_555480 [Bimuria novae-zelandiae CBS 107.79]
MFATGTVVDMVSTTSWDYDMKAPQCFEDPAFFFPLVGLLNCLLANPPRRPRPDSNPFWLRLAKALTAGTSDCAGAGYLLSQYPMVKSPANLHPGSLAWLTAVWDAFTTHCLLRTGDIYQHILLTTPEETLYPDTLSPTARTALGFLNYLANILIPNRLFTTRDGAVGLAPGITRPGDMLAVINGCHMPYVVRSTGPVKYDDECFEDALQIVGPCYLQGVMRGEIFEERGEDGWGKLEFTRYEGDGADSLDGWLMFV